ncbi:hypothetical protein [Paenibacillus aestuarii]|uniref:Rod shape-determining protein MreD n=1 Tax=Paenibacillus aestuarii TaxID=516965 RepID=A0ABW0KFT6_9BACL|nr:hypothetical protein [Paenibacillus aestuarii]
MILYLPLKFDANEWFILIAILFVFTTVLLLPKRFSTLFIVFMMLFNVFIGQTVDYLIAVPPYDLYDVNDRPDYELFDFLLYFLLYPPSAYIVLYFYSKWKIKGLYVIAYILGCALLTTGLEWIAHFLHVFTYKGWKLVYSFPVYIGVYSFNILVLRLAQTYVQRKRNLNNI